MTPPTVKVEGLALGSFTLVVRADYELRYKLSAIPGARWNAPKQAWTFPCSPTSAKELGDLLGHDAFAGQPHALKLLEEGERQSLIKPTAFAKDAELGKLDPIPLESPTQPWKHQLGAFWFCMSVLGIEVEK